MMENEFVPYEIALAMKELGFNEICLRMYKKGCEHLISTMDMPNVIYSAETKIQAPLYQQAFRWFREEHNLFMYMQVGMQNGEHQTFYFNVIKFGENLYKSLHRSKTSLYTYEEAELVCLRKLIEIVNQNKDDEVE